MEYKKNVLFVLYCLGTWFEDSKALIVEVFLLIYLVDDFGCWLGASVSL